MEFELKNLPRNASKETMVAEIRRVDTLIGKEQITTQDFNNFSKLTAAVISKKFGGWEKALFAAGLGHKYSGIKVTGKMDQRSKKLSNEEIINEMRRVAKSLSQDFVTQENLNSSSEIISGSTVVYRFGSYEEGVRRAGLKNSPGYNRKFSNEEYFENLLNVWTKLGRQPFLREMDSEPSKISSGAYEGRFGTWRKALEAFIERMSRSEGENGQVAEVENMKTPTAKEIKGSNIKVEDRRGINLGLRYKILRRDNFKCVRCGTSPALDPACRLHIDHVVPFSRGGKTTLENLQTLCEQCNLGKGNHFAE